MDEEAEEMTNAWVLAPLEPTPEMSAAGLVVSEAEHDPAGVYRAMILAAPKPPHESMTAEEARDCQIWAGMDGACAFHLIDRHADGWGDTGRMMGAWLDANKPLKVEANRPPIAFDEWFDREGHDEQHRFEFGLAWNSGMDSAAGHDRQPLPRDQKNQHAIEVPGFGWVAVKAVRAIERAHGIREA